MPYEKNQENMVNLKVLKVVVRRAERSLQKYERILKKYKEMIKNEDPYILGGADSIERFDKILREIEAGFF